MDYKEKVIMDSLDFVMLSDYVPGIVQEIRYYSTYNHQQINQYLQGAVADKFKTSGS